MALSDTNFGTNGTIRALEGGEGPARGSANVQEVIAMIDPVTASNDRLRNTDRWGYTGELLDDPVPVEESRGAGNRLLWIALLAIAVVVLIALFANPV